MGCATDNRQRVATECGMPRRRPLSAAGLVCAACMVAIVALPQQTAAFVGPLAGRPNRVMDGVAWQRQRALWLAAGTQEKEPLRIEALDVARQNFSLPSSEALGEGEDGIGRAKALAKPNESRAAQLREAKAKERASKKKPSIPNPFEIPIKAGRAARRALEALGKIDEPAPTNPDAYRLYFDQKFLYAVPKPNETTPTVLVVGATGETGRQVVRKLVLKGYRVQVLVRNLYSSTLNLLGSGVSYAKGELTDLASLRSACDGVDKVVFVAQARNETDSRSVEFLGLRNLAQAYQDTRITTKGKRVQIKRTLFKFRKGVDRDVWGVSARTAKRKGVTASWAVENEKAGRPVFTGLFAPTLERGDCVATLDSKQITLNLGKFSGLLIFFKASGDEATGFRFVIRTGLYESQGIQYEMALPVVQDRFVPFRMNFKDFVATRNGQPYMGLGSLPLDPADVRQFAIVAAGQPGGRPFSLELEGVKVIKGSTQPEVVVLSSSDVHSEMPPSRPSISSAAGSEAKEGEGREGRRKYYKAMGELALKNSGLNYCIVRISDFSSSPSEGRPLSVSTNGNNMGLISRADAAEVCVNCLFNSKVVNTEIYAAENPRYGDRDIASLLDQLDAKSF